jgi:iron complex transport system substrate-binding protein
MKKIKMITVLAAAGLLALNLPVFAGGQKDKASAAPEAASPATRVVQDSDGKDVTIPYTITKVAPRIGAMAQITEVLTSGGGEIAAAATNNVTPYFKKVFPDYARGNPNNYSSASIEDIIASGAQVFYGPVNFSQGQIDQLNKAGVAVVNINKLGNVEGLCDSIQRIGNILGAKEAQRAKDFVAYFQGNINTVKQATAGLSDARKVRLLDIRYSAGTYNTINKNDLCEAYYEAAGAVNVAADTMLTSSGAFTIDDEEIVKWNPQVIITNSAEGASVIKNDKALQTIDAVRNGRIYVVPFGVYQWNEHSGEGALYPLWVAKECYPDLFKNIDMKAEVKKFYNTWYSYNIPDHEIDVILAGTETGGMIM